MAKTISQPNCTKIVQKVAALGLYWHIIATGAPVRAGFELANIG